MGFLDDLKKAAQDAGQAVQRGVDNIQKPSAPPEPPPVASGAPPEPPPVASTVGDAPQGPGVRPSPADPPMAAAMPSAPMAAPPGQLAMPPITQPPSSALPQLPSPDGAAPLAPPSLTP